ncbi:myelin expression factor 2-like isoform X2 [Polyodon spathula]|uniref:myelin expression factor 2-like isoform X2 n=1 Tax=Polyodon spathula TaxID=7913 RepID=UPI001B7DEF29|nr:myelin expression factor 2-like isoform X2 [Polyodon spathula]
MAAIVEVEQQEQQEEAAQITITEIKNEQEPENNTNGVKTTTESEETPKEQSTLKEKSNLNKKSRFQPYSKDKNAGSGDKKGSYRNRVFISNIPYDMKWQAIKDLMREKVGEVTYVELFKDAEGKSRGCGVVEFKDEEFVKKAIDVMNKYDLSGRPLNIKEDPDGEHARRMLQRTGMFPGGRGQDGGPGVMNLPPSIANNPNIPPEIISGLQDGRLGTTVFVANLDFKVGWKKLKEVFGMAGTVKRADVKEDKEGKSRGMGTVTFEQALEAVQAISMLNGQFLFDRPMHVKMDDKSIPHDDFRPIEKTPQLPRGLSGIGLGLGPGGQPINANRLSGGSGGGMGNMGPGAMSGMDRPGFGGMSRMGTGVSGSGGYGGGMDGISNMGGYGGRDLAPIGRMGGMDDYRGNLGTGMGGVGSGMGGMSGRMGSGMGDMHRSGISGMDRDFSRSDLPMNRGYGDSFGAVGGGMGGFGGGMGSAGMSLMAHGLGSGMNSMGVGMGMDRMSSSYDRMGGGGGMDMNRGFGGFGSGPMGGGKSDRGSGSKGCQIFVRNLPFDLTWQKLKENFIHCGQVMFAEIKMENGRSKGCGTVRFDSPESAENACRIMNGTRINGREVDVRMDRNA